MPTLRRSKSLNDKLARQKNRTGDIVRDPRSPDVEGRTRQCVDNFQALLHVKKQTEDRARQLDLALSYAANGGLTRPRGLCGGVELPYPGSATFTRLPETPEDDVIVDAPPVQYRRRQRSADGRDDGRPNSIAEQQHRLLHQELQQRQQQQHQQHQHQLPQQSQTGRRERQQQRTPQRPASMFEPRLAPSFFPTQEELAKKDQVIQSLTESQRSLNKQNQTLLSKIDELEFQVSHLKEVLRAHNVSSDGRSASGRQRRGAPHQRDAIRTPEGREPSAATSPNSEHSVSGYGSLAGSACDGGAVPGAGDARGKVGVVVERVTDGYDDDSLRLSVCSTGEEARVDTLPRSSSSGDSSLIQTLSRDSDVESLHEKVDQVTDHQDRERSTSGGSTCPQDLEKQVTEVTAQRDALLQRYKHLVDVNQQVMKRDEQIETALRALLKRHGKELQSAVRTELKTIRDLLCDLEQDIRDKVDGVLSVLGPQDSQRAKQVPMDKDMASALERIVDLIGPEYGKLGKRLGLGQKELERVESARETFAEKNRLVLRSWLCARGGASQSPAQELTAALRDIDKDVNLLKQTPISGPERQALRNCLQYAVDHVTDPLNVLDHLIVLNDLTPGGIAFVQEVRQSPERVLCRLWHVAEYRGVGIVSRMALALQRAAHPHVARKLTDELEIQNSRVHSRCHPISEESNPAPTSRPSRPLPPPPPQRSRPVSRLPRPRSKVIEEHPIAEKEKGEVWNRQPKTDAASSAVTPRSDSQLDNSRVSEV